MRAFVLLAAAAVLTFIGSPADACTCSSGRPLCQTIGTADAVFEATVDAIEGPSRERPAAIGGAPAMLQRKVRLRDIKAWTGQPQDTIDTGLGGGDCGYNFMPGVRYFITAYKGADGALSTSICSQTRPVSQAGPQLEFLTSVAPKGTGSSFAGTVLARNAVGGLSPEPLAGVQVTVKGPVTRSARTDAKGAFSIPNLPIGQYEIALTPPADRPELAPDPRSARTVSVENTFACFNQTYTLVKGR